MTSCTNLSSSLEACLLKREYPALLGTSYLISRYNAQSRVEKNKKKYMNKKEKKSVFNVLICKNESKDLFLSNLFRKGSTHNMHLLNPYRCEFL